MCAQNPVTHDFWEGLEDDWITVETCRPNVISENKCCADVKIDLFISTALYTELIHDYHLNYQIR